MKKPALLFTAAALALGSSPAQSLILTIPGEALPGTPAVGAFGIGISTIGDLDGDGHDDLLIGSPSDARAPTPTVGSVRAVSGRTGLTIRTWTSPTPFIGSRFGISVAGTGDVNGDGTPDFLVGDPDWNQGQGCAFLVSGHGPILAILPGQVAPDQLGGRVEALGDFDGDGTGDYLVVNHDPMQPLPRLRYRVFSGATLAVLHEVRWVSRYEVVGGGDIDGDGHADLLIADITASLGSPYPIGEVEVFSGRLLRVIASRSGTGFQDYYGQCIRRVGDVNGDGREDFAAFGWHSGLRVHGLSPGVRQYGPSFFPVYAPDDIAPIGDVDADGSADFAVGVESGGQQVDFVSGATMQTTWFGRDWNAPGFAARVQLIGDVDADGVADVAVTAPFGERSGQLPAVFVYSVRDRALTSDIHRIPLTTGGVQDLQLDFGANAVGRSFVMLGSLSGVLPGTQIGALRLPLNADPYTLSMLGGVSLTLPQVGTLDAFGRATSRFALPPGLPSGLAGWTFHHAALTLDPSGIADVSQAVPVTTTR